MEQPSLDNLPLMDSHLDLAENVTLFGRDLTLRVAEIRALERRTARQATVSLPELERGPRLLPDSESTFHRLPGTRNGPMNDNMLS